MTSIATSWNNIFDRHRARVESERVESVEDGGPENYPGATPTTTTTSNTSSLAVPNGNEQDPGLAAVLSNHDDHSINANPSSTTSSVQEEDEDEALGQTLVADRTTAGEVSLSSSNTHRMTIAELEEERELARRRSSACVMFAVFVLFRLWIEALQEGDFGLLMLCLVGTSWTARWIRHNREREDELDRRIQQYLLQQQQPGGGPPGVDRHDLRMLSFQAQLALAIMESQRQMMENGGYGNEATNQAPGVSEEAKNRWEHISFKVPTGDHNNNAKQKSAKGDYGSVSQAEDALTKPAKVLHIHDEEPHCSICLCEYEDGETLVKLPCSHIYHGDCINAWTSNHVKCPLCNFDLETAPPSTNDDSIV